MPRTKLQPITDKQLSEKSQRMINSTIVSAMGAVGMSKMELAEQLSDLDSGMESRKQKVSRHYDYICRRFRLESEWTPSDLMQIVSILKMTNEQILMFYGRTI